MKHTIWRTLRRFRAALTGGLMVAVVCLCLVVGVASPSDALNPGAFEQIGETLAGDAGDVAAVGGDTALCATGLGCAAAIGMVAYGTRDVWMPVVKDLLGGLFSSGGSSGPVSAGVSASVSVSGAATGVTVTILYTGAYANLGMAARDAGVLSYVCVSGSAATSGTWSAPVGAASPSSSTGAGTVSVTWNPCSGGQQLGALSGSVCVAASGTSSTYSCGVGYDSSPAVPFSWSGQVPSSLLSVKGTSTCRLPDGTTRTVTIQADAASGNLQGDALPVPSCQAAYPGSEPTGYTASSGYKGAEQTTLTATMADRHTLYPNCYDGNGAWLSSCKVRVYVNGQPCHVGDAGCVNWQTAADDDGYTVTCQLGPSYTLPLSACDPLARQYQPNTGTTTLTLPGAGNLAGPGADASSGSDSSSQPSSGTEDNSADSGTGKCDGMSWSLLHPIALIENGVKCALEWAFVPDSLSFPPIDAGSAAPWLVPFSGTVSDGCGGWSSTLTLGTGPYQGSFPVSLPDTCSGIGGVVSGITRVLAPALLGYIVAVRAYRRMMRTVA